MRNLFIFFFLALINCDKYDPILEGLTKNYVLLHTKMDRDLYDEYFKSDKDIFLKDSIQYFKALNEFYDADTGIIDCLTEYEGDSRGCDWIATKDPYSSTLSHIDIINTSEGALILIDNYLLNANLKRGLIISPYIQNMSFHNFKVFYEKNKTVNKGELTKRYQKYIKSVGN